MRIGETVEIGLPEQSLLKLAFIAYTIPLFVLIFSVLLGNYLFVEEWQNIVFTSVMTALAFVIVKLLNRHLQRQKKYQPILIERII